MLQPPMQHAEIVHEAGLHLRLQPLYGHTQPANGRTKAAYVHPKAANRELIIAYAKAAFIIQDMNVRNAV